MDACLCVYRSRLLKPASRPTCFGVCDHIVGGVVAERFLLIAQSTHICVHVCVPFFFGALCFPRALTRFVQIDAFQLGRKSRSCFRSVGRGKAKENTHFTCVPQLVRVLDAQRVCRRVRWSVAPQSFCHPPASRLIDALEGLSFVELGASYLAILEATSKAENSRCALELLYFC